MKKYIGIKQVEAEPMTMGQAYERGFLQVGRVPSDVEQYNKPGYHVKYIDGCEDWMPSEPFEEVYKCADSFLDRLTIEREELYEKLSKLRQFIESPKFLEIVKDKYQRQLLSKQESRMSEYLEILDERIKLLQ